jgi:hypothetical protein
LRRAARLARLAAIAVIVGVIGVVIYQLYDFYGNKVGNAPERVIGEYVGALTVGDYETAYRLTAKAGLVDLAGRPVSQSQYVAYLHGTDRGGEASLTVDKAVRLAERAGSVYYEVLLRPMDSGAGQGRMLLAVRREASDWLVVNPFPILP